jgi:peroxiredoxin (alkyl hydroperoxide reductase subunit C)
MLVGTQAPDFRMLTTEDLNTLEHVTTRDAYRGRWLVLFFYPADFTFICPTEALAFDAAVPAFAALGADVLGVSTDSVHAHVAWMEFHIGALSFPLASDRTQQVSRSYGVLDAHGQAARATFVIDPAGVVRYEAVHDDRVARSVDEVLRVLTALHAPGRTFGPTLTDSSAVTAGSAA